MSLIDENLIEETSIEWFEDLGYQYVYKNQNRLIIKSINKIES